VTVCFASESAVKVLVNQVIVRGSKEMEVTGSSAASRLSDCLWRYCWGLWTTFPISHSLISLALYRWRIIWLGKIFSGRRRNVTSHHHVQTLALWCHGWTNA